jgi:uncharacterized FlaG/YvyC family protein
MEITTVGSGPLPRSDFQYAVPVPRVSPEPDGTQRSDAREAPISAGVLKDLEKISLIYNRKLQFSFDKDFGDVVVKVVDGDTDKIIREIPPKELQNLHIRIREALGVLFDKKA